jgi:hypothetical protein
VKINRKEGLIEKSEISTGIFVASLLTTVKDGYVVTSILNTNDQEVVIPEPKLRLVKIESLPVEKEKIIQKKGKY